LRSSSSTDERPIPPPPATTPPPTPEPEEGFAEEVPVVEGADGDGQAYE
jgi:hypothetical protein